MTTENINTTISCLCGKHQHTYAVPRSINTIDYFICHCNSCRKSSGGSLYQGAIVWNHPLIAVSEQDTIPNDPKTLLKQYDFGPILDYWFCETCSTKIYWQYKKPDAELELFPGLLPESLLEKGGIQLSCLKQVHVADTLDEGLSRCFKNAAGIVGERCQDGSSSAPYVAQQHHYGKTGTSIPILAKCHCGKTDLKLQRKQYSLVLDTTDQSRLLNSIDLSFWAVVDRENIMSINNMPLHILEHLRASTSDGKAGSLSVFDVIGTSTRIWFCNGCSATIFTQYIDSQTSNPIKIGAGLLTNDNAARAEDILEWSTVESFESIPRNIHFDQRLFQG